MYEEPIARFAARLSEHPFLLRCRNGDVDPARTMQEILQRMSKDDLLMARASAESASAMIDARPGCFDGIMKAADKTSICLAIARELCQ